MAETPPIPPYAAAPPPAGARRNPLLLMLLIAGLVVLAAVVFGGAKFMSAFNGLFKPTMAADAFFKTIAREGPDSAYAIASPAFRAAAPLATWEAASRSWNLNSYTGYDWDSHDVTATTARFQGRLHLSTGADLPATLYLRKEGKDWRVASVNVTAVNANAGLSGNSAPTPPAPALAANAPEAPPAPSGLGAGESPGSLDTASSGPADAPRTIQTPDGVYAANQSALPPLGRAGPPGTYLAKGAIAMQCLSPLARIGFRADRIDCGFTRMETVPGRQGHCTAYTADGRAMNTTLTFLDYDPVTNQGRFDCHVG